MSQPYVGEIRIVGFNFAPVGWAFCDGSLIAISQNSTLFNLIGTTYGGDGVNTFALPDLRGRVPVHMGSNGGTTSVIGQISGTETVTLTTNQIPAHTHAAAASGNGGTSNVPTNNFWANWTGAQYTNAEPTLNAAMRSDAVVAVGGGQPHENMMPFLAVNFIISMFGIYPSQS
jgi:microcystin-dependent protein